MALKAVGLLSKLLSNADGYEVSIGGLAAAGKDGRDAIRSGLNELMALGYVERTEQQRIGGKFTAGDYLIREVPISEQDAPHRVGFSVAVKPSRKIQRKEIPKEEISTKKEPPKAPQGATRKEQGRRAVWMPDRFEGSPAQQCEILVHNQGWNLHPLRWKPRTLTTVPPGKSSRIPF